MADVGSVSSAKAERGQREKAAVVSGQLAGEKVRNDECEMKKCKGTHRRSHGLTRMNTDASCHVTPALGGFSHQRKGCFIRSGRAEPEAQP